jgi:hypothetical protein
VQAEWEPDELIGTWTLVESNWDLIANKAGVTRLGFAVMLKFYEIEGRFPAYPEEVPPDVVRYLGSLVKVDPALFAKYSLSGRSIKYHRSQIRKVYGTRRRPRMTRIAGRSGWPRRCARPRRTGTGWRLPCGGAAVALRESGAAEHRPGRARGWPRHAAGSTMTSPLRPPGGSDLWCAAGWRTCCRGRACWRS